MGRRSKSAKSSINNLGSKAQKQHSVTNEDTNNSVYELGPVPHADPEHRNEGKSSEEGFVFEGNDGSLILIIYGLPLVYKHNAKASNVYPERLTVVAHYRTNGR